MWAYQKQRLQDVKRDWNISHREFLRLYRQWYRANHPEETQKQRLKDWRSFVERNPERWREINREKARRYRAKQKALRQAEREAIARKGESNSE